MVKILFVAGHKGPKYLLFLDSNVMSLTQEYGFDLGGGL
jgi:hypothetical protein